MEFTIIPFGNGGLVYGLRGILPRQTCFFDHTKLKMQGVVFGSSSDVSRSYYSCSKCKLMYDLPLNEKERDEHRKRMKEMLC